MNEKIYDGFKAILKRVKNHFTGNNPVKIEIEPIFGMEKYAPEVDSDDGYVLDLFSATGKDVIIHAGCVDVIPLGFKMRIPEGYGLKLKVPYSLVLNHYVSIMADYGVFDCNYRDELKVVIMNHGKYPFTIYPGMIIANATVVKIQKPELEIK